MLRAITERQRGRPPRLEWKASYNGQYWKFVAACVSEARAVALRAPWSLRMLVHELVAAAQ